MDCGVSKAARWSTHTCLNIAACRVKLPHSEKNGASRNLRCGDYFKLNSTKFSLCPGQALTVTQKSGGMQTVIYPTLPEVSLRLLLLGT